jgi:hypothetical protein
VERYNVRDDVGLSEAKTAIAANLSAHLCAAWGGIDVERIRIRYGEASVKPSLSLCAAGAMLVLPTFAWANSLGNPAGPSIQAFSYIESELGAIDPADLSATTEDYGDGIYDRFADQIETLLAPIGPVDPTSDRMSWAILVIAFAGMTTAASGRRSARRATISI